MNPTIPIDQILENLQRFEKQTQVERARHGDVEPSLEAAYEARLERIVKELRDQVKEQESALEELRASVREPAALTQPSPDPKIRLKQFRTLASAYTSLTQAEDVLPAADSPLPALLAIRNAQRQIVETKESIHLVHDELTKARKRLEQEESDLRDTRLMHTHLEQRLEKLRAGQEEQEQRSPEEIFEDLVQEKQAKIAAYESETKRLVKAFNDFIESHLAAMLAAEELGGPIVGELGAVDEDMLAAGFTSKGKTKKLKTKPAQDSLRQQRIDQIWGRQDADEEDNEDGLRTEKDAAGAEIRTLTEDLLNALAGSNTSPYVELPRDSAAARFLVRSKIAQYHPKDARRLRLIDFAKELDD
ncbi:hypothetical protein L228DRAFT_266715 [Xylona heveae TC161]|uniref:Uncharacterized protein n=1 Tax=Xylona heveae (strain CBS 132557 / TC161) TaxID=1328760 RepID=A0A165I4J6_XYLHT|nr:hypothetical protein L228DRAFT_266715 [Xylona heveae TC161]KZF24372.1 hypothetical protein L228DRAFT_266715 [Xylona heveae TC161]